MTNKAGLEPSAGRDSGKARGRRWRRWLLVTLAAIVALSFAGVWAYSSLPTPAPLALRDAAAAAPIGELDGTWAARPESQAGFRIKQTILGMTSDVVARTSAVSGAVVIVDGQAGSATFDVDLTTLEANGRRPPQVAIGLDTANDPTATITLEQPVTLDPAFASGTTMTATVAARLELRGTSHAVTLTISARRDGPQIQVAGSIPVAFADWGIPDPTGYGWFASVADHAIAEFSLVLDRR